MSPKITLIGAGSVVFAKRLISDILQLPALSASTICLMDIDPARLKVADVMVRRIIEKLGVRARVVSTLDQREAIRDANYVFCTIQVGGYKPGTILDFEIPAKYGVRQTIADTLGVGGVFRALRTIPVINSIARDIADVGAPECLLLNYTNPMAMNCWAVARDSGIPHVGLCHSVQGTSHQLTTYLGLPREDISYLVAGINHMAFFLRFDYRGQDAYPLLFQLLDRPDFTSDRVRFEMMRRTGFFVTESSEHQSEYVPYFIQHGDKVIKQFDIPLNEYLRRCEAIIATWENSERELLGDTDGIAVEPPSHEYGAYILNARETNQPVVIYGNVPNDALITNLPHGCCVEVPCLVDAAGVQPTRIGDLPPQLAALCQTNINVQSLTVEAALTGKREHIYHAVMLDPHTASVLPLDRIWAMCDELIAAHQEEGLLGEFSPTLPGTGRAFIGTGDRITATVRTEADAKLADVGKIRATICVTNPGPRRVRVPLVLRSREPGLLPADVDLHVSVPPRGSAEKSLTLAPTRNDTTFSLILSSPDRNVLATGCRIPIHPVLDATNGPAPLTADLAGFPAVKGTIGRSKSGVTLALRIEDSLITPQLPPKNPWTGSCSELFFTAADGAPITQLFLVPGKGRKPPTLLNAARKILPTPKFRQTTAGTHYEITGTLPWKLLGIQPTAESFLFDAIFTLSALGDAHSGGRTPLHGCTDSHKRSDHFARVVI